MVSRNADACQIENGSSPAQIRPFDRPQSQSRAANTVFKSGPLLISSKGLGWTSWKKQWFILTRTSLVFFRNDPNTLPQKGEMNLTLGGIDLNNSGSVVVRADKKLLTVLFPNGGDGRGFTLKAETLEDLYEWKAALENALSQAPNANLVMGQSGIFRNDAADNVEGSFEQCREKSSVKSVVIGRPILLALEDIDGSPSFLEKALRFIEEYGIKVEGILRQAADVEEVELRVREYEEGKTEFTPDEDAHLVGDCVKHVLRELPSSPVPASCCTALLQAYRRNQGSRVDAVRDAVFKTFPEPNRHLLQRLLKMMHIIASHQSLNRMSASAVAACMSPLLLRPLLAGECELGDDFDISGDGSSQLLAAASAANHAHAIVTMLLEEYESIFEDDGLERDSQPPSMYSDSEGSCSEAIEDDILNAADDGYHDPQNDLDADDDNENLSGISGEESRSAGRDLYGYKVSQGINSDADISNGEELSSIVQKLEQSDTSSLHPEVAPTYPYVQQQLRLTENKKVSSMLASAAHDSQEDIPAVVLVSPKLDSPGLTSSSCLTKTRSKLNGSASTITETISDRKKLSLESIELCSDDERIIQRLEITKLDLQNRIAKEAKGNAILRASLERRKQALLERRLTLEQDVARLQEQLQKERDLRGSLESGLNMPPGNYSLSYNLDTKTKAEMEEIGVAEADVMSLKQRVADLHLQLNQQQPQSYASVCESCRQHQKAQHHEPKWKVQDTGTCGIFKSEDALLGDNCGSSSLEATHSTIPSRKASFQKADFSSMPTHDPDSIKKLSAQDEGLASTSSTLVELTSRLNFLKERRSQLLNELKHLDGLSRKSFKRLEIASEKTSQSDIGGAH